MESCPKVENRFGYNYGVVASEGEERSTMATTSHTEIHEHKTKDRYRQACKSSDKTTEAANEIKDIEGKEA